MGCPTEVEISDNLVFTVPTHDPTTGALTDADAVPDYWVYEDETGTAILNSVMAKLDDANTTGFYSELIACSEANGFETGKTYTIYIEATVGGVKGGISYGFKAYTPFRAAINNIATGSAAISTTTLSEPDGFVITTGLSEANNEDVTFELDGITHDIEDNGGTTDVYYIFNVGGEGVPSSITWQGYVQSQGDSYAFFAWNWSTSLWQQVGTRTAINGTIVATQTFDLTNSHVGTGDDIGEVRFRIYSEDGTKVATDRILCHYAVVAQTVGYANGAIWVDSAGTAGSTVYVNGVADNPCPWVNALIISASLGIKRFEIANENTVTLDAALEETTMFGEHWYLALGGQSIDDSHISGAEVSGISSAANHVEFHDCTFGAGTYPPGVYIECGFGVDDGLFTATSAGEYSIIRGFSLVPGMGTPDFTFAGLGPTTGIGNRGWLGGFTVTLDSDCTLSHEVLAGGTCSITTGGADVEIRGITRALNLVLSGAKTVQFVGTTGPIDISGTATTTVNLYGISSSLSDTSIGTTVNNFTISAFENVGII